MLIGEGGETVYELMKDTPTHPPTTHVTGFGLQNNQYIWQSHVTKFSY